MFHFSDLSIIKLPWMIKSSYKHVVLQFLLRMLNPFGIEFSYFIFLSLLGFGALKASKPRTNTPSFSPPRNIDLFFTSVSASTVSSMSTVEMEVFSNTQLIFLTVLMFVGGEIFTSMLGLQLSMKKFKKTIITEQYTNNGTKPADQIELGIVVSRSSEGGKYNDDVEEKYLTSDESPRGDMCFSIKSIELLSSIVLCYFLVVHVLGSIFIYIYTNVIASAREVLEKKRLHKLTFAVFTTVSTFANCGFVPTNENMIVFKKNSGLLLIMIPQILLGNTLYASFLRLVIWASEKLTKREELTYLLKNSRKLGYRHLFSGYQSKLLAGTVLGFVFVQFVSFCAMEWNSEAMDGLSNYQKLVGSLFEVVNSRHAGESIVDLSSLTTAVLVIFGVMMYLSPYTSFLPIEEDESVSETKRSSGKQGKWIMDNLKWSKQTYLVIFIILICIAERKKMKEDPLNFNLLSIVIEVISAYGNVGFSMGYSCGRQIKSMGNCKDASYGFAGKWSDEGKFLLIAVMFFGRLKKFSENGGKSWKVL